MLRFSFRLTPGANNGIGIRAPGTGDAAYAGMEVQVLDDGGTWYTLTWDGATNCDGCGTAATDEGDLGSICADWSPLTEWRFDPWSG